MTKQEKLIISAYTGILMVNMDELQAFIEKTLGRSIWTHELANDHVQNELRAALKPEFLKLCEDQQQDKSSPKTNSHSQIEVGAIVIDDDGYKGKVIRYHSDLDMYLIRHDSKNAADGWYSANRLRLCEEQMVDTEKTEFVYFIKNTIDEWNDRIIGYYSSLEKAQEALKDCCDWYRSKGTGRIYRAPLNNSEATPELVQLDSFSFQKTGLAGVVADAKARCEAQGRCDKTPNREDIDK